MAPQGFRVNRCDSFVVRLTQKVAQSSDQQTRGHYAMDLASVERKARGSPMVLSTLGLEEIVAELVVNNG